MELPELITSLFEGIVSGVLVPVLRGLYEVAPFAMLIAVVAAILACVFAQRVATKVGSVLVVLLLWYLWPHMPDLLAALAAYGGGSVDLSAAEAAQESLSAGVNAALDAL